MRAVCLFASLCILVVAEGASMEALFGPRTVRSSHGSKPAAAMRFAGASSTVQSSPTTSSVVTREGLGENLPYPGSEYLGMGYNAIRGNPDGDLATLVDPGWVSPALRFGWCQNNECLSRDFVHLKPMQSNWASNPTFTDVAWARPEGSCERSKRARTIQDVSDYASSLSVDASVSVEGGFFGGSASFSASAGMDRFRQESSDSTKSTFQVKSYCTLYSLGYLKWNEELPATLMDPVMKKKLDALPAPSSSVSSHRIGGYGLSTSDYKKWYDFFETYGTHYSYEVRLGGKFMVSVTIEDSTLGSTARDSVRGSIEASFDGFGGGVSAAMNTAGSSSRQSSLANMKKTTTVSILGGTPPSDAEDIMSSEAFGFWAESVVDNPMPVQYKLAPISKTNKFARAAAIYGASVGRAVPERSAISRPTRSKTARLHVGDKLFPLQRIESGDRYLTLTEAGALEYWKGTTLKWTSGTTCSTKFCPYDTYAVLQDYNVLAIYQEGVKLWGTRRTSTASYTLVLDSQRDEPRIIDDYGWEVWTATTNGQ